MATDLIIDGYNLLHATGIFGRGVGPGGLERSRRALLAVLAASLDADQRARTTVVFDAGPAGRGLPDRAGCQGIRVLYARRHEDADALIEELIRTASAPRNLVVVSSDHRLQRAARRRRARPVDSDRWYAQLLASRQRRHEAGRLGATKPPAPLTEDEVAYWLARFARAGKDDLFNPTRTAGATTEPIDDPFPPGYAEDLLEDPDDPDGPTA